MILWFWHFLGRTKEVTHKLFHHISTIPYCRLDITVTAPHSVCSVLCVNMEPASAFLLLLVLCAMFTYSFMRDYVTDRKTNTRVTLSAYLMNDYLFYWEERIPGSLEKLPVTPNLSTLWLILHRGQLSSSRSHLSFKLATIYEVQEVTTKKALRHRGRENWLYFFLLFLLQGNSLSKVCGSMSSAKKEA